ncbi:alkaline phosphatase family protein [Planctomyces sp. SH-PL62]|uniref:alkaline phosphatase family protein n=1 Tax=Planctomyces sp. SH-PL62 TaxID=1636152 RepID=UPI00078DFBD1|nr:nucleotide pyrophosphatase/phosphodiesterase family protein [Planctomyces sp. SH-PL62]AMV40736.1 Type I phosphodiesterase / nucleotide pyrophosphatase [Planctomyces sp. SH-PL62]
MLRFLGLAALALATVGRASADSDRHVVVISLDGFPAWYLDDPEVSLPVIRGLRDAGASTAEGMHVSNPSVTWPNHTTLMTGVRPEKHGVLYNGVPKRTAGAPTVVDPRKTQQELVRVPLLFDIIKPNGLTSAAVNWPCTAGSESLDSNWPDVPNALEHTTPRLKDELVKAGLTEKFERGGGGGRDEAWTEAAAMLIRERKPNLLALHLLELDSTHHQHGPNTPQGRAVAGKLDALVGKVVQAIDDAGLRDKTTVFVLADHGFIANSKTLRPNAILRKEGLLTMDGDKVASARAFVVPEGGIGMVYLTDPATRDEDRKTVRRLFEGAEGVAAVIDPEDFPRYGLPKPEDHSGMADVIIAAKEGYGVGGAVNGDAFVQEHSQKGTHGYLSTEPNMNALFVVSGAGIKPGAKLPTVENVDVAPTVAHLLGAPLEDATGRVLSEFLSESK